LAGSVRSTGVMAAWDDFIYVLNKRSGCGLKAEYRGTRKQQPLDHSQMESKLS
jgi:hypothetical protein